MYWFAFWCACVVVSAITQAIALKGDDANCKEVVGYVVDLP